MAIHQGAKLRFLRLADNRTNPEIAALWGMSIPTMYTYFEMEEIPLKKLNRICDAMGWDYKKEFGEPDLSEKYIREIEVLKRENQLLTDQVAQLKQIIELTKRKK